MSARGTRILSRLFQATVRMKPDKKSSDGVEGATPVVLEKDLAFEPDFSSSEHERVWDYHTRLVFKDGRFVVRILLVSNWHHTEYWLRIWIWRTRKGGCCALEG